MQETTLAAYQNQPSIHPHGSISFPWSASIIDRIIIIFLSSQTDESHTNYPQLYTYTLSETIKLGVLWLGLEPRTSRSALQVDCSRGGLLLKQWKLTEKMSSNPTAYEHESIPSTV